MDNPQVVAIKRSTLLWLTWLVSLSLLASVFVGITSVIYANKVGVRSDQHAEQLNSKTNKEVQNFCDLLITLDRAYQQIPPSSDLGRAVATAMHNLKVSNCG